MIVCASPAWTRSARRCAPRSCRRRSNLCTCTTRVWPMRWARSVAWSSTAGFHQRSKWKTWWRGSGSGPARRPCSDSTSTPGPPLRLEARDHPVAILDRGRAVQVEPLHAQRPARWSESSRPISAYCVNTSALSPSSTTSSSISLEPVELAGAPRHRAGRPAACAGWLQTCFSRVSGASTRPRRWIPAVPSICAEHSSTTAW